MPSCQPSTATAPKAVLDFALREARAREALLMPMGLWVGGSPALRNPKHPLVSLLFSYKHVAPVGLQGQMGTPRADELEEVLGFVLSSGASWIELWHHDIAREDYAQLIRDYHEKLRRRRVSLPAEP